MRRNRKSDPPATPLPTTPEELEHYLAGEDRRRLWVGLRAVGRGMLLAAVLASTVAGWWGWAKARSADRRADQCDAMAVAAAELAIELELRTRDTVAAAAAARRSADAATAAALELLQVIGRAPQLVQPAAAPGPDL